MRVMPERKNSENSFERQKSYPIFFYFPHIASLPLHQFSYSQYAMQDEDPISIRVRGRLIEGGYGWVGQRKVRQQ